MASVVDTMIQKVNLSRAERRNATLEDLGGELVVLSSAEELMASPVVGAACLAIAADWERLVDKQASLAFFKQSFGSCGDSVFSEVGQAMLQLPPEIAAQIAPDLLILAGLEDRPERAAYAGEFLVTLALAELVGWAPVVTGVLKSCSNELPWPANEVRMRSVLRIALSRPSDFEAASAALAALTSDSRLAADAHFALGQVAFSRLARSQEVHEVDRELGDASNHFASAVLADCEHEEARFMGQLVEIACAVQNMDEDDNLHDLVDSVVASAAQIARFGMGASVAGALDFSTRAAWVKAAETSASAVRALGADRDFVSSYEILEAVCAAQRFTFATEVGNRIWFDAIERSVIEDAALIAAAKRVVSKNQDGELAKGLNHLLEAYEGNRGKGWAGTQLPATKDELISQLVDVCLADGNVTLAGQFESLRQDELLGTPEFDHALENVLQPLLDDPALEQETISGVTLAAAFVLSYARRKTDATRRSGGFRDLANSNVTKPLEHHLQDDIAQAISTSALASGWTDERTNMSGGRADGKLVIGRTHIPFEFKAEAKHSDPESLRKYVGQAQRYTGGTAACAFLVVLDTSKESERYNDIASQSWTVSIVPAEGQERRTTHVITVVIPANMPSPSWHSK